MHVCTSLTYALMTGTMPATYVNLLISSSSIYSMRVYNKTAIHNNMKDLHISFSNIHLQLNVRNRHEHNVVTFKCLVILVTFVSKMLCSKWN